MNLGDDAIMQSTLGMLTRIFPGAKTSIAANDPGSWMDYKSSDVRILSSICTWVADCRIGDFQKNILRMPFSLLFLIISSFLYRFFRIRLHLKKEAPLLDAYYDADVVYSCGGGNYYAHHSPSPGLFWNLVSLGFANWLGKKTIMLPQSIGPISGKFQFLFSRWILNNVDQIYHREHESYRFVKKMQLRNGAGVVIPDLAFNLSNYLPQVIQSDLNHDKINIGVTIINRGLQDDTFSNQQGYEETLVAFFQEFHNLHPIQIHFFVQCTGPSLDQNDTEITMKIYERIRDIVPTNAPKQSSSALDLCAEYKKMDMMIGSRMHTGILALISGTPTLLIGYQPKAIGMMDSLNLREYCTNIGNVSLDFLLNGSSKLTSNNAEIRNDISEKIETQLVELDKLKGMLSE